MKLKRTSIASFVLMLALFGCNLPQNAPDLSPSDVQTAAALTVQAALTIPVTETATVWDYGLSRVYFENNRVVRWEDSPMQRLRVSR